jgi:hypothetical protein
VGIFIYLYVCSLIAREWINQFAPNLARLFPESRKRTQEAQNSGNVSWVRFPVQMASAARKLSKIEERCPDQSCLFRRGDYRNEGQNPEKLNWVRFPMKMVSAARKLSKTEERRPDQSCLFRRGDNRNEGQNPENLSWVRLPVHKFSAARKLKTIEERLKD